MWAVSTVQDTSLDISDTESVTSDDAITNYCGDLLGRFDCFCRCHGREEVQCLLSCIEPCRRPFYGLPPWLCHELLSKSGCCEHGVVADCTLCDSTGHDEEVTEGKGERKVNWRLIHETVVGTGSRESMLSRHHYVDDDSEPDEYQTDFFSSLTTPNRFSPLGSQSPNSGSDVGDEELPTVLAAAPLVGLTGIEPVELSRTGANHSHTESLWFSPPSLTPPMSPSGRIDDENLVGYGHHVFIQDGEGGDLVQCMCLDGRHSTYL